MSDSPSTKLRLIEGLRPKPLAKCRDIREQSADEYQECVRASIRALLDSRQYTLRGLARHMECSAPYLLDVLAGRRPVLDWVPLRLPQAARAELGYRLANHNGYGSEIPPSSKAGGW